MRTSALQLVPCYTRGGHIYNHVIHSEHWYHQVYHRVYKYQYWTDCFRCDIKMRCDLVKPFTCAKLIFLVIGTTWWKFELSSFQNRYLEILWYWYQKLLINIQRLSKRKKKLCCQFPYFCSFTLCDMWQIFPDHITNMYNKFCSQLPYFL